MTSSNPVSHWISIHAHTNSAGRWDGECISCSCGHRGLYTETHVYICLVNWGAYIKWRREPKWIACNAVHGNFTWTIFLSDMPATKRFCLSSSGLNLTQYGTFLLVKREMHWPMVGVRANWKSELQNNPPWLFRKVHSSCLKCRESDCNFQGFMLCPCRQRQLSRNTENPVFLCIHSAEVNHSREGCYHYC